MGLQNCFTYFMGTTERLAAAQHTHVTYLPWNGGATVQELGKGWLSQQSQVVFLFNMEQHAAGHLERPLQLLTSAGFSVQHAAKRHAAVLEYEETRRRMLPVPRRYAF